MPGLPTPLPGLVGLGTPASAQTVTAPWDVVIGGFGFMLNNDPNTPFIRAGADYRSPYVNYTGAPGEQALGFWWPRTQYAWQGGAGNPTFDGLGSGDSSIALTRFYDSAGVDVFSTHSQFTLLKDVDNITSVGASTSDLDSVTDQNGNHLVWRDGLNLKMWDGTGSPYVIMTHTMNLVSSCTDGYSVYMTTGTDIHSINYPNPDTVIYSSGLSGSTNCVLRYAKQRLMFGQDNHLYELNPNASSAALPSPLFTHPNPKWTWTDIKQGPGAIYACGYAGTAGAVYMFVLNTTTGALPVLTGGIVACELPEGEVPNVMLTYLDLFMGIGTSRGVRICSFNADNSIILAPLTVDLSFNIGAVRGITAWDRFLYVTCDHADPGSTACGLLRVDMSFPTDTNRYAYARDLRANSNSSGFTPVPGAVSDVAMLNGNPAFLVPSVGLFSQNATRYCLAGFLQTSRFLFGMTDFKVFARGSMLIEGVGEVTMSTAVDQITSFTSRVTGNAASQNRVETSLGDVRGSQLSYRFDLDRATTTTAPIVQGYTARALPSQAREDSYTVPLRCYDRVENKYKATVFQSAITSLNEIANLMRFQTPVVFQTFFGEPGADWTTNLVQVETYEFKQATGEDGWGGTLTLTLRTLTGE